MTDDKDLRRRHLEIMVTRSRIVKTLSRSLTRDDAEDVASDVLLRLMAHQKKETEWPENLPGYMYRIAYNVRSEWIRSNKIIPLCWQPEAEIEEMESHGLTPEMEVARSTFLECIEGRLRAYIRAASNTREKGWRQNRAKVVRMWLEDFRNPEISEELGHANVNVTEVFLNACRAHLQPVVSPCMDGAGVQGAVA